MANMQNNDHGHQGGQQPSKNNQQPHNQNSNTKPGDSHKDHGHGHDHKDGKH